MNTINYKDIINSYSKSIESFVNEYMVDYEMIGYDVHYKLNKFIESKFENFDYEYLILSVHQIISIIGIYFEHIRYNRTTRDLNYMLYHSLMNNLML